MNYGNNDYSTTSYSAQGGAGGGGFMTGGGSQTSPSGGSSEQKNETLRPVTIKQVNESETQDNTSFNIDNSYVSQITFVGQVRNTSTQTTNITYKLDDGTGTVEVKQWIDTDSDQSSRPKIEDNSYVRVWGKLKQFNNKKHVGAHFVRPISDFNEISYHLLEATVVHLHFTRGPPAGGKAGANGQGGKQMVNGAGGGTMNGDPFPPGISQHGKLIFNCLKTTPQSNEGLHQQDIASRLRLETVDIQKAGDELLEAGLIYTTVDDQTWAILSHGY